MGHEADSLIKILLECGANPNIKNAKNETVSRILNLNLLIKNKNLIPLN
jgi:hypothetical protein